MSLQGHSLSLFCAPASVSALLPCPSANLLTHALPSPPLPFPSPLLLRRVEQQVELLPGGLLTVELVATRPPPSAQQRIAVLVDGPAAFLLPWGKEPPQPTAGTVLRGRMVFQLMKGQVAVIPHSVWEGMPLAARAGYLQRVVGGKKGV